MTLFQSIILGLVQGVAEFLPISSSGHLLLVQKLFGLEEIPPLFDIVLHLPSLLAVCIFFRKKIARLFAVLFRWVCRKDIVMSFSRSDAGTVGAKDCRGEHGNDKQAQEAAAVLPDTLAGSDALGRKTIIAVIITTLVTGVIGVFTSKVLDGLPIKAVFCGFLFTAALLVASGLLRRRAESVDASQAQDAAAARGLSWKQAALIGLMQGIGTLPGVSRSGSTISGALFCGVDRTAAGEYSFIVSIPAILGAFVLEARHAGQMSGVGAVNLIAACLVCFAAAYASLSLLMKLVKKGRLEWFAAYLLPLGIAGLILF